MSVASILTGVAEYIRFRLGTIQKYKLEDMESAIHQVYEKAYSSGENAGYEVGYSHGTGDGYEYAYDEFWDAYQENGALTDYNGAFYGFGWNEATLRPKHDIKASNTLNMFRSCQFAGDVEALFNELEIGFDTSEAKTFGYMCYQSQCEAFPEIDLSKATDIGGIFGYCRANRLKIKVSESTPFNSNAFTNCAYLAHIEVKGVIGKTGFDIHWSYLLDKDSLTGIINALSEATSGLTVTLSKTAVNNAFETLDGVADGGTSQEWLDLIATKSNWTISLV